ncbi:MAG TPA: pilus assembly protein PilX [Porticoccaceae bacterium]|nr:pilus assembly protein PilX [Porticoccaceae bacterium]
MNYLQTHTRVGSARQRGAALVFSLILLLALTFIGVSTMQGSVFEEKMAGNARDKNFAFQAAESALRDGELWIADKSSQPVATSTGSNGVWTPSGPGTGSWWQSNTSSWWSSNGVALSGFGNVYAQPMRVVEEDEFVKDSLAIGQQQSATGVMYYRVTARGMGGTDRAVVQLQSTYARRF